MFIKEFEGFRGVLAMWVFFSHILAFCGYPWASFNHPFKLFVTGTYAVDCFIILSGFVIALLIDQKEEKYSMYIKRRFLRLYPLYIVCIFLACLLYIFHFTENKYTLNEWIAHIGLHLTMLHGVIPDSIIKNAPGAILNPAWSISLEWQFYLVIPVFFYFFKKHQSITLISSLILSFILIVVTPRLDNWHHPSFLPLKLHFFIIGITSYFIYKTFTKETLKSNLVSISDAILPIALFMFLVFIGYSKEFGILVFLIFFISVMTNRIKQNFFNKTVSDFFNLRTVQNLGKISYSIYLIHEIVLIIIVRTIKTHIPNITSLSLLVLTSFIAIPITILLSSLSYKYIEKRFIKMGKTI
ncbi:acyltransferase family protein [Pedobacter montanisoli]|uniref:Acyltransferase n=1 Tax=Pedobacter montanisoli TaxID=2923277 RepID=A0ABS9ZVV5_9SPHI|nr:acyltransferase [Pedobacter montanisoli]MCJ0742436.1 acyltransferase [Pedobacter montanisoli]